MGKEYHKVEKQDNMVVTDEAIAKEEVATRPKARKMVSQPVVKGKPGLFTRLVRGVVGPDGFRGIFEELKRDIIVPSFKDILVNSVKTGIDIAVYKDARPQPRSGRVSSSVYTEPKTKYDRQYVTSTDSVYHARRAKTGRYPEEYQIADRREALEILVDLKEAADHFGAVPLADYYDRIGVATTRSDYDYGWTYESISRASVVPYRGVWMIKFPPMEVL